MILYFAPLLAALGAALAFRGRQVRGLLIIAAALSSEMGVAVATQRWDWVAFTGGMIALCAVGILLARRDGGRP